MHPCWRRLALLLAAVLLMGGLTSCGQLRNARPITDVEHLDGQRVGVVLSWAPDYLLSEREDLTLMRYNTMADAVTALCFQRVDALSVEEVFVPMILQSVQGVRCIEDPITHDGITALISPEREDLLHEYNAFIREFRTTPEYADLAARSRDRSGFTPRPVPEADSDRVLQVGLMENNYPFCYLDLETGEMEGIDLEVVRWFAYEAGYRLELSGGTWNTMELGVCSNRFDMGISGVSNLYRGDYEATGRCFVSDVYLTMDILFIEIEDPENLAILATLEW